MLDHLSIQCADLGASSAFYDAALGALGGGRIMDFGEVIGYGKDGQPTFWLGPLTTGEPNREIHVAFAAADRAAVRAFFDASAARAAGVARVPPELLRRLRARPRRQQRRGLQPHGRLAREPEEPAPSMFWRVTRRLQLLDLGLDRLAPFGGRVLLQELSQEAKTLVDPAVTVNRRHDSSLGCAHE